MVYGIWIYIFYMSKYMYMVIHRSWKSMANAGKLKIHTVLHNLKRMLEYELRFSGIIVNMFNAKPFFSP